MDDFKVQYCEICYTAVHGENYETEYAINDTDFDDSTKPVMCNACSKKFYAAQSFKLTCSCTDNVINSYVEDTTILPLELREIYMKERPGECISDDTKICRLCMQLITGKSEFQAINEDLVEMIQKFVPDMNIFIIKEPVMCKLCLDSLAEHCNFLNKSSYVEEKIENVSIGQESDAPSTSLPWLNTSVKIENVDVEFEDVPEFIKTECFDIKHEESGNESGQETSTEATALKKHEKQNSSKVAMYKCETCDYKSSTKSNLKLHLIIHKDRSEVQMYKCEVCNYETRHKTYIKNHMLKHKDPTEVQMYKCENCNFETKYKKDLRVHILVHKDPSEVPMYKCEHCNYQAKNKKYLKRHMFVHKSPSEVQMYKCNSCDYESKFKYSLTKHALIHKDPSEVHIYKCENCSYESVYRKNYENHVLIHKNPSELKMYKCEICNYEARQKCYLKSHMLKHKDPSEVKMFRCEICGYKTKYKSDINRHVSKHQSSQKTDV